MLDRLVELRSIDAEISNSVRILQAKDTSHELFGQALTLVGGTKANAVERCIGINVILPPPINYLVSRVIANNYGRIARYNPAIDKNIAVLGLDVRNDIVLSRIGPLPLRTPRLL